MKDLSIYIHIPFCERKCNYCAFVSYCLSEEKQNEYIDNLICEIENFAKNDKNIKERVVKTIYFGGGTPSLLSIQNFHKIFKVLNDNFKLSHNAEITIEVNPNSVDVEKLLEYKKFGINRVSVGVQSLSSRTLKQIGRLHDKKTALNSIKLISQYFDNISADLIIGLQGEKNITKYAKKLIKLKVKHISCYMLEIHENTKMLNLVNEKKYKPLSDDMVVKAYTKLSKFLTKNGFLQYEISNFAQKGYESKHNLTYWTFKDYVGFGVSAHSYIDGVRYENASNLKDYYLGKRLSEPKSEKTEIEERIMLGLRCYEGVSIKKLKDLGYNILENENCKAFLQKGILRKENGKLFLEPSYYVVSDYIIEHLIWLITILDKLSQIFQ